MNAEQVILTRQLPKTGQVVQYMPYDDGQYEAGWWKGRLNANNKVRFIAKTISGDAVVIDRATGLMWGADGNAAGCWNGCKDNFAAALGYANSLTFAGFNDWRVPNIKELLSIVDYSHYDPAIDANFFPNTFIQSYWSSTASPEASTTKFTIDFAVGDILAISQSEEFRLRSVRKGV